MLLTELPTDILVLLPSFLHSIDDLYSVISTCRTLQSVCYDENVKLRPELNRRDGQYLLQPHPHLLIAGTARQVGDWAVQTPENRTTFHNAVRQGVGGLLTLCQDVARMSFTDMRNLHNLKHTLLKDLTDRLERENPKEDDPNSAFTELEHADLCILNIWIYSDLFHHSITASYRPVDVPAQLTNEIRLDYVKNCIPDENAGPLDFASGQVQWLGKIVGERSELSFQQLDLIQLDTTAFSFESIGEFVFPGEEYDHFTSFEAHVEQVIYHSGLAALRFLLILPAVRPIFGRGNEVYDLQTFNERSPEELTIIEAITAIKDEMVACRKDGRYAQARAEAERDPLFDGIFRDCYALW